MLAPVSPANADESIYRARAGRKEDAGSCPEASASPTPERVCLKVPVRTNKSYSTDTVG